MKFLKSAAAYLIANAIGLLLAVILLPGFSIDFLAFVVAVLLFSVILAVLTPIIRKVSEKSMPQLMGGIALITIFVGLLVTELIMPAFTIGGLSNWVLATLLVWVGSLIASFLIPRFVFTDMGGKRK
ncbi:MAG: phage holin family protein [Pseudomonadota bacterium]